MTLLFISLTVIWCVSLMGGEDFIKYINLVYYFWT